MDSGAVRNVTPPTVFSDTFEKMEPKYYYGADGSPIPRYGKSKVRGENIKKGRVDIDFEVAKVSRPLASAGEMVRKNKRVVLEDLDSYAEHKRTSYRTPLRFDGNLFYLDLWVRVPEAIAEDLCKRASFARRAN